MIDERMDCGSLMFAPRYLLGCRGCQNWTNDLFLDALISRFIRVFTDHPGDGDLVEREGTGSVHKNTIYLGQGSPGWDGWGG